MIDTTETEAVARAIAKAIQFDGVFGMHKSDGSFVYSPTGLSALSRITDAAGKAVLDHLTARDAAVTRKALQMAADAAYKWWDGEPEDALELRDTILALSLPASNWQEVPEGYVVVNAAELEEIARQHLASELTFEASRNADFEGAYDIIVSKVRAMIKAGEK